MSNEIQFIDTSEEAIKTMTNLAKKGLRKAGKLINNIVKEDLQNNHSHTGNMARSITSRALVERDTGQPKLMIGYRTRKGMKKKYGIKYFVNPAWLESGVAPHIIQTKQLKNQKSFKRLSYELKNNKGQKFGYQVQHPGERGMQILKGTVLNNIDKIREAEAEVLEEIKDIMLEAGADIQLDYEEDEID